MRSHVSYSLPLHQLLGFHRALKIISPVIKLPEPGMGISAPNIFQELLHYAIYAELGFTTFVDYH